MHDCYADLTGFNAVVVSDRVALGNSGDAAHLPVTAHFGAIYQEFGAFQQEPVQGILGLAYRNLTGFGERTLLGELARAYGVAQAFTLCLGPAGGALHLGAVPADAVVGEVHWVANQHELFYQVLLADVVVGGVSVVPSAAVAAELLAAETIVDSGTTLVYLPDAIFEPMARAMLGGGGGGGGGAGEGGQQWVRAGGLYCTRGPLPSLAIALLRDDGSLLYLPLLDYWFEFASGGGGSPLRCLGILPSGGFEQGVLLGDAFTKSYAVAHDHEGGRIGFGIAKASRSCASPRGVDWGRATVDRGQDVATLDGFDCAAAGGCGSGGTCARTGVCECAAARTAPPVDGQEGLHPPRPHLLGVCGATTDDRDPFEG